MSRPNLTKYLAKHLRSLASLETDAERHWNVCCSTEPQRKLPRGDESYTGDKPRPWWNNANPLWMVPVSATAEHVAKLRFDEQEAAGGPAGAESRIALSTENGSAAFSKVVFQQGARFEPSGNTKTAYLSSSTLHLHLGRWFRLGYKGEAALHVWISSEAKYSQALISFPCVGPSFVAGARTICGLRAALRMVEVRETSPIIRHFDYPCLVFEAEGHEEHDREFACLNWFQPKTGDRFPLSVTDRSRVTKGKVGVHRSGVFERPGNPSRLDLAHGRLLHLDGASAAGRCLLVGASQRIVITCRQDVALEANRTESFIRLHLLVSGAQLVKLWNDRVGRKVPDSLSFVRRGAEASVAPVLVRDGAAPDKDEDFVPGGTGWMQIYRVQLPQGAGQNESVSFSLEKSGFSDGIDNDPKALDGAVTTQLRWRALKDEGGLPLRKNGVHISTRASTAGSTNELQGDDGTLFEFFIQPFVLDAKVRDGALDIRLGGTLNESVTKDRHFGRMRTALHYKNDERPLFLFQWDDSLMEEAVELSYAVEELILAVSELTPGAEDARPEDEFLPPATSGAVVQGAGERTEPPLIIPMTSGPAREQADRSPAAPSPGAEVPARYLLIANESTNVAQSLRLDLRIEALPELTGVNATARVIVLDAAPQLVAQVRTNSLQLGLRDSGTNVVARRSPLSEERDGWEFFDEKASAEGFELRLPAQVLGEQAVKARDDFPENDHIADSRFGPPAILRIASERLDRGFVAVPWNLRRILLDRGNASPGVPLLQADFELLYGLSARLKHPGLLLGELGGKIGELPTPALPKKEWPMTVAQTRAFSDSWQQFLRAYRAWLTRVGVLEVSHEYSPLRPLELKEGIEYRVRVEVTPDPNEPKKTVWQKGAHLAWPQPRGHVTPPAQIPKPGERDPIVQTAPDELKGFHGPDGVPGLQGGAVWGFEQLEIYREFWRHYEKSSSGEINGLAFSSLGGYGRQTARFAHDKTIIQSTTAQGRTHVYAVERIGRIGVFWNKAKHVILYERTTVPSKQFHGEQYAHLGRPLLRKVREFIEILEPERQYPDFADQDASAPGSIKACVFRSRILPVNSTWGRTVFRVKRSKDAKKSVVSGTLEAIGWEIPIWREGLDPEVYPKPQILLHLAAPADSDVTFVPANFEQPQVLRFYTDTRDQDDEGNPLTAEVHLWPEIEDVDYTTQPDPTVPNIAPSESKDGAGLDAPLPGAALVPPGFERFTFMVAPSDLPADVAAAYFEKASINGKLRTVTMMRGEPAEEPALAEAWWRDAAMPAGVQNARTAFASLVKGPDSLASASANGFAEIASNLRSKRFDPQKLSVGSFQEKAQQWLTKSQPDLAKLSGLLNKAPSAKNRFKDLAVLLGDDQPWKLSQRPSKAVWVEILEGADGVVVRVIGYYDELTRAFKAEITEIFIQSQTAKADALIAVDRLIQRLKAFSLRLDWQVPEAFELARFHIRQWSGRAGRQIAGFFSDVRERVADIAKPAGADVPRAKTELKNTLAKAKTDADAVLNAVEAAWSWHVPDIPARCAKVRAQLATLQKGVGEKIDKFVGDMNGLIEETRTALDAGIATLEAEAKADLDAIASMTLQAVNEAKKALTALGEVGEIKGDVQLLIAAGIDQLKELRTIVSQSAKKIEALQIEIEAKIVSAKTALENVLQNGIQLEAGPPPRRLPGIRELLVGPGWVAGKEPVEPSVYRAVLLLDDVFREIGKFIDSLLPDLSLGKVPEAVTKLFAMLDSAKELERAIKSGKPDAIIGASEKLANDLNARFGKMAGEVAGIARDALKTANLADAVAQEGKNVLRNARSVWDEFTAPGMGFNRRTIEMVVKFNPKNIEEKLGLTPCIARVKELGDQLEGLGLRFPTVGIADRLLPAVKGRFKELEKSLLDKFDFSDLMSDIGGMRLTKLLPGLKMPQEFEDKIRITQGFDKEKLKAWVNAESDVQFKGRKTLMSFGPLLVSLDKGHFTGQARVEADADGKVTKVARGALSGDWTIAVGGTEFITYEAVVIRFEGGKIDFDLDPSRMRSPGLMKLMTDVSQTIPMENGGFKVGIVNSGGFPVGVRADLELGPFGGSGGVSGISNLLFGAFFELRVFEPPNKFEFAVMTGFHVGRQETPFDLQVFILGGGGYLDLALAYKPAQNALGIDVALAVHASASLRVDVGWMRGGVAIYLGLEAEYHKKPDTSPAFHASLFIMVEGYVSIINLITVHLMLRLACTFMSLGNGGTELVGSGMVTVTIRISRFFKIRVRKTYTRIIARSGGSDSQASRQLAQFQEAQMAAFHAAGGGAPVEGMAAAAPQLEHPEVNEVFSSVVEQATRHIQMLVP